MCSVERSKSRGKIAFKRPGKSSGKVLSLEMCGNPDCCKPAYFPPEYGSLECLGVKMLTDQNRDESKTPKLNHGQTPSKSGLP